MMNTDNMSIKWLLCPICQNKTRVKVHEKTILINFPLFCPKCKQEMFINLKDFKIYRKEEPDAQTQSQ